MGYDVLRRRNLTPGIDFIADFRGEVFGNATLLKPPFAPTGRTAFSVKAGDFEPRDIRELADYVAQCGQSPDGFLRGVQGGVIVANAVKTSGQLDAIRNQGIYCWDTRRLIFYSIRSKKVAANSELGAVVEHSLNPQLQASFTFTIHDMQPNDLQAIADVFIDDHTLLLQGDNLITILTLIQQTAVHPTAQQMHRKVKLKVSIHSLGPLQRTVVED